MCTRVTNLYTRKNNLCTRVLLFCIRKNTLKMHCRKKYIQMKFSFKVQLQILFTHAQIVSTDARILA